MSAALGDLVAGVLLLAVAVYSTAGGTDFGAGIWDLLAGGEHRGAEARALIDHAMAPVWEANNVWLVFAAVVCWTGFPLLFQSLFASLYPLYTLALLGLILRGSFFAFRKVARTGRGHRAATIVFGMSSVLTPFFFAASLGAVASGRVGVGQPSAAVWQACLNPTSVAFGAVALAATAFSGGAFLVGDARRYRAHPMVAYFRRRAIIGAGATLLVAAVAMGVIGRDAPGLFHRMVAGYGLPFAIVAVAATLAVAALLWRGVYLWYRVLTVMGVGSFVFAWGAAQAPYLLPGKLTIQQATGAPPILLLLLVVTVVALLIVVPSLGLLYTLDQRNDLEPLDESRA